jgi:hypothetical protein
MTEYWNRMRTVDRLDIKQDNVLTEQMDCDAGVNLDELERMARLSKADKLMNGWTAKKCATFVVNSVVGYAYRLMDRRYRAEKAKKAWLDTFYEMDWTGWQCDDDGAPTGSSGDLGVAPGSSGDLGVAQTISPGGEEGVPVHGLLDDILDRVGQLRWIPCWRVARGKE